MQRVLTTNLWTKIQRLAAKRKTKKAAIAYVTTDKYVDFGKGDSLIVDASEYAVGCGQTSARVLKVAYKRGAKIFSSDRLHAKFLIFAIWRLSALQISPRPLRTNCLKLPS